LKNQLEFSDSELTRVKKALATVSACHKVLVRARDKVELLEEICRALIETGGYRMAWIGISKNDGCNTVQQVAWSGFDDGYLDNISVKIGDKERGLCPTGMAIKTKKPYVVKDILACPDMLPWRGEALKRGYASCVALPMIDKSGAFGALNIFSDKSDIFHEDEVVLLKDLVDNIVYGLVALHTRIERNRAENEVQKNLKKLRQTLGAVIQVLEQTVEVRDPYTAGHQRRVADLARAIAEEMGLSDDQIDGIRIAGIIHDIGKMYVPAEILSKPWGLSQLEFSLIKTHPQVGYDILKAIEFPWPVANIVLQHHERINGSGYPFSLPQKKILIEAKILGVADVVEAMASHRPYRPALGLEAALDEISHNKGKLYDTEIVDTCLKLFKQDNFTFEP